MLEIIALIFLTRNMGMLASRKGLKPGPWKLYTVLAWIGGEVAGALLGIMMFGGDNMFSVIMIALAGAITGYLALRARLNRMPDDIQEDIDRIGVDDLRP